MCSTEPRKHLPGLVLLFEVDWFAIPKEYQVVDRQNYLFISLLLEYLSDAGKEKEPGLMRRNNRKGRDKVRHRN